MSTEIRDQSSAYGPHFLDELDGGWVNLNAHRPGHEVTATMPRADFLSAVETECGVRCVPADAIVIERPELPYLITRVGSISAKEFTWSKSSDPDDLREIAACYLAAAEYLAAHPPVPPVSDEDVETLAGLLVRVAPLINGDLALARRLLATGRVSVTHE